MPRDDGHDIAIVSDLRLTARADLRRVPVAPNGDDLSDAAFGRFVDHLIARARREDRRWRLVLLGDLVDFLRVRLSDEGLGATTAETSVRRLDAVAAAHPPFFATLGRLLADGHRLDLVVGDRDLPFVLPAVQRRLRRLLVAHAGADAAATVAFHPWIFFVPGLLYAEHGHRYDPLATVRAPLAPFLPADPSQIELPLGSLEPVMDFGGSNRAFHGPRRVEGRRDEAAGRARPDGHRHRRAKHGDIERKTPRIRRQRRQSFRKVHNTL